MTKPAAKPRKKNKPVAVVTISDRLGETLILTGPTELLNCRGCTIHPRIVGGSNCLLLNGCEDCSVLGGWLKNPDGKNDPNGHCFQALHSKRIKVIGVLMSSVLPTSDKCNVCDSENVEIRQCRMIGPNANDKRDVGAGGCADAGSSNVLFADNVITGPGPVGLVFADGHGHKAIRNVIRGFDCGVQIGLDDGPVVSDITIIGNTIRCPQRVWAAPQVTNIDSDVEVER